MENKTETSIMGYVGIVGCILDLYWDKSNREEVYGGAEKLELGCGFSLSSLTCGLSWFQFAFFFFSWEFSTARFDSPASYQGGK